MQHNVHAPVQVDGSTVDDADVAAVSAQVHSQLAGHVPQHRVELQPHGAECSAKVLVKRVAVGASNAAREVVQLDADAAGVLLTACSFILKIHV